MRGTFLLPQIVAVLDGGKAIVVSRAVRYMIGLDTKTGRLLYRYDTIRKR